jgi:glutathione S-transferase
MKLYARPVSPYVRKVRVFAKETGTESKFETFLMLSAAEHRQHVPPLSPMGKIPVMELDNGKGLADSPYICEMLDSLHNGPKMFPTGPDRWPLRQLLALGDGITDCAIMATGEARMRPEPFREQSVIDFQLLKTKRGLDALEQKVESELDDKLNVGVFAVACALGYLAFRLPDFFAEQRATHPKLYAWYDRFSQRPSMIETAPYDEPAPKA